MRQSPHMRADAVRRAARLAVALTALCGVIGARPTAVPAQDAAVMHAPGPEPLVDSPAPPSQAKPPPGPMKVLSWNVGSSPYAVAMRKIKVSTPSWRTSFGSERRTVDAPPPPQASFIDADVVLLQGITNPRALRRLFPARKWRLIFSRRALETLPKGSVFTAPVSSVEVEAVAVRYRDGLRVVNRGETIDERPSAPAPDAAVPPTPPTASPGLAVKVIDRGRTLWLASVTLDAACPQSETTPSDAKCQKAAILARWRVARLEAQEDVVSGGRLHVDADATPCQSQGIEAGAAAAKTLPRLAKGENRSVLGCVAELILD